jgi:hypothetical protein
MTKLLVEFIRFEREKSSDIASGELPLRYTRIAAQNAGKHES